MKRVADQRIYYNKLARMISPGPHPSGKRSCITYIYIYSIRKSDKVLASVCTTCGRCKTLRRTVAELVQCHAAPRRCLEGTSTRQFTKQIPIREMTVAQRESRFQFAFELFIQPGATLGTADWIERTSGFKKLDVRIGHARQNRVQPPKVQRPWQSQHPL